MSQKYEKYYRKKAEREARAEIERQFGNLESHLKPKPWYIPTKVWAFGMRIFIQL